MFKRLLAASALCCISLLCGCFYYVNPDAIPVDFGRRASINFDFQVFKPEIYWFQLRFDVTRLNESERLQFRKLLERENRGDGLGMGAISVPMRLAIFSVCSDGTARLVLTKEFYPVLTGWGEGVLNVNIDSKELLPGHYRAKLESANTVTEFGSVPATFSIGVSAKTEYLKSDSTPRASQCQ